ncbi:MAG: hypothetical protein AB1847_00980 [bacterium]
MNYSKAMGNKAIGIFGDLVGLEDLPSRGHSLGRLRILLDKINATFEDNIHVGFTIINDTEFKGAFDRSFPLQDFLSLYNEEFGKDIGTHLGIGLGVLGPPEETEPGGCFFSARKAMAKAKEGGSFLLFHGFEMSEALNALFYFIHEMDEAMTDRQRKIVEVYRKSGDVAAISNELYIPKQGVLDSIKAARYDIYVNAWRGLEKLLKFDLPSSAFPGKRQQRPQGHDHQRSRDYQRPSYRDQHQPHQHQPHQQRPPRRDYQRPQYNDYPRSSQNDQQRPSRRDYQRPSNNDYQQRPANNGYQQRSANNGYQQRPANNGYQRSSNSDYQRSSYNNDQQRYPHQDQRRQFTHDNRRTKKADRQRSGPSRGAKQYDR